MKEILFGTTNEAKINQVRGALASAGIKVRGVTNKENLPVVHETGSTSIDNARLKAVAYAKALGEPVFSMDNALYINGVSPDKQPGVNVRRIKDVSERATDQQMIEYYSNLIRSLGGKVTGYWEFGVCIACPNGKTWETTIRSERIFTGTPSQIITAGYPLESIQIDPDSGKYISEMTQEEQDLFWQKSIGEKLLKFVESVNL